MTATVAPHFDSVSWTWEHLTHQLEMAGYTVKETTGAPKGVFVDNELHRAPITGICVEYGNGETPDAVMHRIGNECAVLLKTLGDNVCRDYMTVSVARPSFRDLPDERHSVEVYSWYAHKDLYEF